MSIGIFMILALVGYPYLSPKYKPAQNIFDEMYSANVDRTAPAYYRGKFKVNVKTPRAFDEDMNEQRRLLDTHVTYQTQILPKDYQSLTIYFYAYYQYMTISFNKEIDEGLVLNEFIKYAPHKKLLEKSVMIIKSEGNNEDYIQNDSQVKAILRDYHLGKKDLDGYYDEIVNNLILKDWLDNYDSKFSSNDYGKIKIKTQWENW